MVIDAGSTGSRAFVFRFVEDGTGNRRVESIKGKRAVPGLSSFAANPEGVTDYFEPLFLHAVGTIPPQYHNETIVYIKGTAGMRLLKQEEQDGIWNSLVKGLAEHHNVPFIIHKENFGTIDGHMEAYYAVLSSNYIAGSIDGNLKRVPGEAMVGALDMGGSSTQLIFHTETGANQPVQEKDFWSHSWLNYGVEKVRERVWDYLVSSRAEGEGESEGEGGQGGGQGVIDNPCAHAGQEVLLPSGHTLVGTGNRQACQDVIMRAIWAEGPGCAAASSSPCYVDSVRHPPVRGLKFYGMSVYYYAFDCIRQLGGTDLPHWPTPTLDELEAAVDSFCAVSWATANATWTRHSGSPLAHAWTLDRQLPHRCLETTYLLTLLRHGFGFSADSRDITLALEVKKFEVEWTLGFALAEVCLQCVAHYTHTDEKAGVEAVRTRRPQVGVVGAVRRVAAEWRAAIVKIAQWFREVVSRALVAAALAPAGVEASAV